MAINQILISIQKGGPAKAYTPKDFVHLAPYETAKKSLLRLSEAGTIRRVLRGVYDYPKHSALLNGPASPDPDAVTQAIARAHGWTIVPTGETALNVLGLSPQVPAQWEFFTDGPTKRYGWEGATVILKHKANKEIANLSPKTALLVQAIKALGETHVDERALAALLKKFTRRELRRALEEAQYVTGWVYEVIKHLADAGNPRHA
jgi:hypothetical protein